MKTNIRENIEALDQGEMLLRQLSDTTYRKRVKQVFKSAVGTHIRHNLDHYACFLSGLESGCIDYTARNRDSRLEQDRLYAITEIVRLRECLENMSAEQENTCLLVKADIGTSRAPTSIKRELEFLLSHSIHHYALVAIICRLQGIEVEPNFGIAPSTLRHLATQAA